MPNFSFESPLALSLVVVGSVLFSMWAERFRFGRLLSSTLLVMLVAVAAANLKIVPTDSPVYGFIYTYVVPLALPFFLFSADLKHIFKETGRISILFLAGAIGVVLGAVLAVLIANVGENEFGWAATYSASYIGGTINFVSMSETLKLPEDEIATAIAVDTVLGMGLISFLIFAPALSFLADRFPPEGAPSVPVPETRQQMEAGNAGRLAAQSLAAIFVAVLIYFGARWVSALLHQESNLLIIITGFTLLFANALPRAAQFLRPALPIGLAGMLAFFFVIGASADLQAIAKDGSAFVMFLAIIILTHVVTILFAAKVLGFRLSEAIIASSASAIGPTVAAGIAGSKGWVSLITPGILLGVLGYAVANFVGLALFNILQVTL